MVKQTSQHRQILRTVTLSGTITAPHFASPALYGCLPKKLIECRSHELRIQALAFDSYVDAHGP
jgi:hypothetical protein